MIDVGLAQRMYFDRLSMSESGGFGLVKRPLVLSLAKNAR